jgi:hypothetical protein
MAKIACSMWAGNSGFVIDTEAHQSHESVLLWLSSERAYHDLGWENKLNAKTAIQWTIDWERESSETDATSAIDSQIMKFFEESL